MTKKATPATIYRSGIAAAMHEMMSDFHEAGVIPKSTMGEFDELCLTPVDKLTPQETKVIREDEHAS